MNLPTLPLALGHRHIKSTFLYERLRCPAVVSPYDRLPGDGLDTRSKMQDAGSGASWILHLGSRRHPLRPQATRSRRSIRRS